MKSILAFFIFIVGISCGFTKNQIIQNDIYQKILTLVINSNQEKGLFEVCNDESFRVSEEVISINAFEFLFYDEIKKHDNDFLFSNVPNVKIVEESKSFSKLGTKRSSCIIFFSEMKDGIIFAELFTHSKRMKRYDGKLHFGTSRVYMFLIENSDVRLVKSKELIYG